MKYLNQYIIIFLALSIIGCRPKPLEIDIDPVESELVVFSQVIPQLAMTVVLTNTISALNFSQDNGDSLTNDLLDQLLEDSASVTISYRNKTDTLMESAPGVYTGFFIPNYVDEVYKLDIETNKGKKLHAESKMLPIVPFEEIKPIVTKTTEDTIVKIAYGIVDPEGDNWYVINVYTNNSEGQDTNGIDPGSFFGGQSSFLVGTRLIDDQIIRFKAFRDTMSFSNLNASDSIVVSIANVNEEYYNYLQLRKTSMNLFSELTKEPINYPSNVENGLGFFNTHFPDLKYFDLSEW